MIELRNGRVSLALHTLQQGQQGQQSQQEQGVPLLLLHELGGCADDFRKQPLSWSGPIHALDLSGHGCSGRIYGAGYYPEMWAADADSALTYLLQPGLLQSGLPQAGVLQAGLVQAGPESIAVLGRGLGAYVALLLAGARAERVRCAVLCEGEGLFEGAHCERDAIEQQGWVPGDMILLDEHTGPHAEGLLKAPSTDPAVLGNVRSYPRPPGYAARFAERARSVRLVESGAERPAWWRAVAEVPGTERLPSADLALKSA